jgi:hypothetical protein
MLEQERSFKGKDVVRFLKKHLLRQIPGKLLISYGTAHMGRLSDPSWKGDQGLSGKRGVQAA